MSRRGFSLDEMCAFADVVECLVFKCKMFAGHAVVLLCVWTFLQLLKSNWAFLQSVRFVIVA